MGESMETILFVDDDGDTRDIAKDYVSMLQCDIKIEPAVDGRETIEKFNPEIHKWIISDFQMPRMTGVELCSAVRSKSDNQFVIHTAVQLSEIKYAAKAAGVSSIWSKGDIKTHSLIEKVIDGCDKQLQTHRS
jgi:CheY-like chemotaxis protein